MTGLLDIRVTEDDLAVRDMVARFAADVLHPKAREIDETGRFITEHLPKLADVGLMGPNLPETAGGSGLTPVALYLAIEEMAKGCMSTASAVTAHYMATDAILIGGSADLQARFLPRAASGELFGAYAMTEPRGGSNPADMRLRAEKTGDGWRLNGTKHYISNGGVADFLVVFAVSDPNPVKKSRGISAFLVERDRAGFHPGRAEPTMGLRGGHIFELAFDDCRVPAENLIGEAGSGLRIAMTGLDGARLDVAAMCTGLAQAALEATVAWAKTRHIDGHPIGDFQGLQWMLADMATELEAARLLGLSAAAKRGHGGRYTREATFAKLYCSEMVCRVTDAALQIHGGYGYSRELPLERYVRDARIMRIIDGSSEIHRNIIARLLLAD